MKLQEPKEEGEKGMEVPQVEKEEGTKEGAASEGEKPDATPMHVDTETPKGPDTGFTLFGGDAEAGSGPAEATEWACAACTYVNLPLLDTCEICGSPKPLDPLELLSSAAKEEKVKAEE